jgi:hypothetical protein
MAPVGPVHPVRPVEPVCRGRVPARISWPSVKTKYKSPLTSINEFAIPAPVGPVMDGKQADTGIEIVCPFVVIIVILQQESVSTEEILFPIGPVGPVIDIY